MRSNCSQLEYCQSAIRACTHCRQAEGAATGPGVSATQAAGVQGLGRGLERHRYAQEHEGRRRAPTASMTVCDGQHMSRLMS